MSFMNSIGHQLIGYCCFVNFEFSVLVHMVD